MRHAEFTDPRLVEVYDAECPWSIDDDFFVALVNETPAQRVLDLGCGTGRVALALAAAGHLVTGVDPAGASLAAARSKPDADRVTWIEGTSHAVADAAFDVAIMTSHVAQVFLSDDEWAGVLADLRRALVRSGTLAFDARDPQARPWERWVPARSRRRLQLAGGRAVELWTDVNDIAGDLVTFRRHYRFSDGRELTSESTLRFRDEACLRTSVAAAGFSIEQVYGGWRRQPVGSGDGELIVIART